MSVKLESSVEIKTAKNSTNSKHAIKILNEEQIPPLPSSVMATAPLTQSKQISISLPKTKNVGKLNNVDHYTIQTFKGEENEGTNGDDIDFVLTDGNETQNSCGLVGPSGEITEELHLSGDEGEEQTEELVEHVCGKCYKTFRRLSGLKKHLDFCRFDSGYHLRKAEMMKNLEKIETEAVIMENKDVCFCCGESYDTFHLGHINCPDCPKSFKSQMSYERHIFITHSETNDFPCTICNGKLRSENLLKLHVEQHQNRGKPFACKICGRDFTRSYHLKRHQKYSSCSASENDSMNCKVCNKVFYRLDNLRAHLKQHLGTQITKKQEYMCPICKNCFYSLSTLNIHTRTHTGERPFDCDLCEKKFPSLVALKKHRRYHTGEKPYTCSVCNQSFAVKEVLNRHMKRHTGERPHVCPECGKSFIQATQLRSHAKTHLKPHECTTCQECFKTAKQLDRHAKTHNRRRRTGTFECKVCDRSFKKEDQLEKHMRTGLHVVAGKRKRSERARTDCAICEKNFDSVQNLQFHILKVHEVDPKEFVNSKPNDEGDKAPPSKIYKLNEFIAIDNEVVNTTTSTTPDGSLVLQEFIISEVPDESKPQEFLKNEPYTVIPLDSEGVIEPITTTTMPEQLADDGRKINIRKSLAASLAAAIANDDKSVAMHEKTTEDFSEEDIQLKENVMKLLDMLVDGCTLKRFGWPTTSEETVLCKVIANCGHDMSKDTEMVKNCDYGTRMREYVKLFFKVVIHNDSIKELLNNYSIDEVIEYVLSNDEDEDESNENDKLKDFDGITEEKDIALLTEE